MVCFPSSCALRSALSPTVPGLNVLSPRAIDICNGKTNRRFDMRCHRIPLFDVASHYFWPRIGQLNPKTLGLKLLFHAKVILSMHSVSYASSRQLRGKGRQAD